jgi:TrmH family RNA methyltransferase
MAITSRDNPKIKQVRLLRQASERKQTGLLVVEGIHHVGEAAQASACGRGCRLEYILYARDLLTSEFALKLIQDQAARGIPCYEIPGDLFHSLAEKENPQGILAVASLPPLSLDSLNSQNFSRGVALVSAQDPGNIGTIIRTVDATGASGLLLLENSADPTHPSSVRASMGALFWYPVVKASFAEFTVWARQQRYHIYGTSAHSSLDYREVSSYKTPLILLLGSEREGLTTEQASICDQMIRMPMKGRVSSLNLAVAAGVMLYSIQEKLNPG